MKKLLVLLLVFGFFLSVVFAQATKFQGATPLALGKTDGTLAAQKDIYYKIETKSGDHLKIKASLTATEGNYVNANFKLYDQDFEKIFDRGESGSDPVNIVKGNDPDDKNMISYTYSSKKSSYITYVVLENKHNKGLSYSLDVAVEKRDDASSGTDAGEDFDNALQISPGSYRGWLIAGCCGNDEEDYYKLDLKGGEKLTVKITPEKDAEFDYYIYDQNRKEVASKTYNTKGTITTVSWTNTALPKTVYFVAKRYYGGDYDFDVSVDGGSVTQPSPTPSPTPQPTPQPSPTPKTPPSKLPSQPSSSLPCLPSFVFAAGLGFITIISIKKLTKI